MAQAAVAAAALILPERPGLPPKVTLAAMALVTQMQPAAAAALAEPELALLRLQLAAVAPVGHLRLLAPQLSTAAAAAAVSVAAQLQAQWERPALAAAA